MTNCSVVYRLRNGVVVAQGIGLPDDVKPSIVGLTNTDWAF